LPPGRARAEELAASTCRQRRRRATGCRDHPPAAPDHPEVKLTVDPLERQGFEYQTGLSFTVFARGSRRELGRAALRIGGDADGEPAWVSAVRRRHRQGAPHLEQVRRVFCHWASTRPTPTACARPVGGVAGLTMWTTMRGGETPGLRSCADGYGAEPVAFDARYMS